MPSLGLLLLSTGLPFALGSTKADRPGQAMPDRHWDMQHLDLDVKLLITEGGIEGKATHHVKRLGSSQAWLRLHQVALDISEVRVNDKVVDNYRMNATSVDIPMPSEGDEHIVSLLWTASPQTGLHYRGSKAAQTTY